MAISLYKSGDGMFLSAGSIHYQVHGNSTDTFKLDEVEALPDKKQKLPDQKAWAIASLLPDDVICSHYLN